MTTYTGVIANPEFPIPFTPLPPSDYTQPSPPPPANPNDPVPVCSQWEDVILETHKYETYEQNDIVIIRHASDDGVGGFGSSGNIGFIDYAAKTFCLAVTQDAVKKGYTPGSTAWSDVTVTETLATDSVVVHYALANEAEPPAQQIIPAPPLTINLFPGIQDSILPGTLRFKLGTTKYSDRDGTGGILYWDDNTVVGRVNYHQRRLTITHWPSGSLELTITSCLTTFGEWTIAEAAFRTAGAPLAVESLQVVATDTDGLLVEGQAQLDRSITGTGIASGTCEYDIGFVEVAFETPVYPSSLKYSAVAFTIIPLRPEIIGIDPARLPSDGRVPKVRAGDYVAIYEDAEAAAPFPLDPGQLFDLPQDRLAFAQLQDHAGEQVQVLPSGLTGGQVVQVLTQGRQGPLEYCVLQDAEGRYVNGALYSVDLTSWAIEFVDPLTLDGYTEPLEAHYLALVHPDHYQVLTTTGQVQMSADLDLTGYTQPLTVVYRWHDISLVVEAQTNGIVQLQSTLSHDYSTAAGLSSLLLHGDLVARVVNTFAEHTIPEDGWSDAITGTPPTSGAQYDFTAYPVAVYNAGAIRERWRLVRRADEQWDVIGETLGVIMVWDGLTLLSARRYATQEHAYFSLYPEGLGDPTSWDPGNFIQFETLAAQGPGWLLRTVRPGLATVDVDRVRLRHRVGAE